MQHLIVVFFFRFLHSALVTLLFFPGTAAMAFVNASEQTIITAPDSASRNKADNRAVSRKPLNLPEI